MKNKLKIKLIILIILILLIIGGIISNILPNKESMIVSPESNKNTENILSEIKVEPKLYNLCYYNSDKTERGFYDVSWLKLNILGEKITGEFNNIPAEKDSKIGPFEGTVGPLIQEIMGRKANVWWNSSAEGMNVKEELEIVFGDGSASVGFGEMIDKGDGVYVYKNKENLTYSKSMSQIDCETLDERLLVEKYVKENIRTIATNKTVLGGTWYVTSIFVNPLGKNIEISYEDGHIQSKANLTYTYEKSPLNITVTKFEIIN